MNVGPHEIVIDGDVLTARWRGSPALAELEAILASAEQVIRSHGTVFVLNDMRQADPAGADSRQYMRQWFERNPRCVLANVGAPTTIRVMTYLMTRAMALLGRRLLENKFFATEAEARAWIDELRRSGQYSHAL